jgi:hypothetical protein
MASTSSPRVKSFQYKIGFSLKEFNEISDKEFRSDELEDLLSKKGFEYKKVKVEEALRETVPFCMDAVYKNPSSMRIDAPEAFSCSSLVSFIYTQAGVWMPSLSIDKYVFGTPISKEDLKFGDLIFSNNGNGTIRTETVEYLPGTKVPEGIDHVSMYLGENKILHATKKNEKVVEENLDNLENASKIVGFRRVADINEERYVVFIPENRDDLREKEDLIVDIISVFAGS